MWVHFFVFTRHLQNAARPDGERDAYVYSKVEISGKSPRASQHRSTSKSTLLFVQMSSGLHVVREQPVYA